MTTRSGSMVSELGYSRQDRCDHPVVLDEVRDGSREVRAFPQQLSEHPRILALVMRRQRGAERQAMGDKYQAMGDKYIVVRSALPQLRLELVGLSTQFLVCLPELQA